jgi:hypothetical protein
MVEFIMGLLLALGGAYFIINKRGDKAQEKYKQGGIKYSDRMKLLNEKTATINKILQNAQKTQEKRPGNLTATEKVELWKNRRSEK